MGRLFYQAIKPSILWEKEKTDANFSFLLIIRNQIFPNIKDNEFAIGFFLKISGHILLSASPIFRQTEHNRS